MLVVVAIPQIFMGNLRILPHVRLSQATRFKNCYVSIAGGNMTENNQRAAYVFYFIITSIAVAFLAFFWLMSPLGLGFASWPAGNRDLLQSIYWISYYAGIPAIVIAQVISPVLFAYRKRKAAYWVPAISIALFLTCAVLTLSNIN